MATQKAITFDIQLKTLKIYLKKRLLKLRKLLGFSKNMFFYFVDAIIVSAIAYGLVAL
ncbi:MAG: hypothetical protein ACP6IS_08600 [Candidatus Asgardarchaeia archaeon]